MKEKLVLCLEKNTIQNAKLIIFHKTNQNNAFLHCQKSAYNKVQIKHRDSFLLAGEQLQDQGTLTQV